MRKLALLLVLSIIATALFAQAAPAGGAAADDPIGLFFDKLEEIIGMEVGALTIGDTTYSKAVIQPTIPLGKLTLGLYLPIIYQGEMFNINNWYMPRGNNEWSFGTDQDWSGDPLVALQDVLNDVLLKIRFIGYGHKRDPFFLAVGSMNDITLGHGLIMNNYANDSDFPVVRRVGIDVGLNFNHFGFQGIANDLIVPEIFGGRAYLRPFGKIFPLSFGVSGMADINPRSIAQDDGEPNPVIIAAGVDLDYPIIASSLLNLLLYADAAAMIPYFQKPVVLGSAPDTVNIDQGFQIQTVLTASNELKNFGVAAGAMGNIAIFDWKLEARFFNGTFRPGYFDKTYDRMRYAYLEDLFSYLQNPGAEKYSGFTLGMYGYGGLNIPDVLTLDSGYMWPWDIRGGQIVVSEEDSFFIRALLDRSVIPYADMELSFQFDRRRLVTPFFVDTYPTPQINSFTDFLGYLVNSDTVIEAKAKKGFGKLMDIIFTYKITLERDAAGNLVLVDGIPQIVSTTSLETSFKF